MYEQEKTSEASRGAVSQVGQPMSRTSNRNALGRGISALITTAPKRPDYFLCAIERIRPMDGQPRRFFEETALAELAASISESGLLQPVLVRQEGSDYHIIAGERRWRAATLAGLTEIPVVLKEATPLDAFALALVENIQREDLQPLEIAEACRRLIDDHGFTQEEVAQKVGKSRSAIANTLRLLKLSDNSKAALATGLVSEGHARQLVGLEPDHQREVLETIVEGGLSVRETEEHVRQAKQNPTRPERAPSSAPTVEITAVEAQVAAHLGARVSIKDRGGRGVLMVHFGSYEELAQLVDRISLASQN